MFPSLHLLTKNRYLVRRLQHAFISSHVRDKKFNAVADVGCGRSPYRKLIHCNTFISVDHKEHPELEKFIKADISKHIPLDDASVDLVLLTEVLEHMELPHNLLKEVRRVLAPGGVVLITTPFVWEVHEAPRDFFRYTKFGLSHLLNASGFKDVRVLETNGFFYTLLQLCSMRMRHPLFVPFVFALNALGYLVYKVERPSGFPLSIHASARKV